jgi:hypothetical protein
LFYIGNISQNIYNIPKIGTGSERGEDPKTEPQGCTSPTLNKSCTVSNT